MSSPNRSAFEAFKIQARPKEHEGLLERQGQSARIVSAKKCPCINRGQPSLHCVVCNGRGYLLRFQKSLIIIDENSPHFGDLEVFPLGTPLVKGIFIQKCLSNSQGGDVNYTIDSNDDTKILISGALAPKRFELLKVTYEYSLEKEIIDEDSEHDVVGFIIHTKGTRIEFKETSNPFNVHGDLTTVTRVFNVTTSKNYDIKQFTKQTIMLDDKGGSEIPIQLSDVLEVDYKFIPPVLIGTGRINVTNSLMKWGEDLKEGDLECVVPGGYNIGKGDIVTLMTPRIRQDDVITRGTNSLNFDELPQFDVIEVIEDIIDEDGVKYDNTKFNLEEYNNLVWETGEGPAQGKKYSVSFLYRPTYRIYKQDINTMTNENKRFPHQVLIRYMNRFDKKELIVN